MGWMIRYTAWDDEFGYHFKKVFFTTTEGFLAALEATITDKKEGEEFNLFVSRVAVDDMNLEG